MNLSLLPLLTPRPGFEQKRFDLIIAQKVLALCQLFDGEGIDVNPVGELGLYGVLVYLVLTELARADFECA